ncbi:MAG: DUF2336 domain-containing protein [Alphaproteobacteria bacterium]|nr:DUF2336 domain-containing protein [Alphaproteobacteria bacterium]
MDLSFLDKTSNVTPLLVRLYDSQKLHGLAKDEKPMARGELVSAISELLDMELSPRESELVADVMIGLLSQAEMDLRQALAARLASHDKVPLRLVLQLVHDDIEVATPVLRHSPVLGDLDLVYIIKSKGPAFWQVIATREKMSQHIMNLLVDTGDIDTALALIENQKVKLSEHALATLSDMSQKSDVLALPLLRREDIPPALVRSLYRFVGEEVKAFIQERYKIHGGSIADAVDEVVLELVDAAEGNGEFSPTQAMIKAAERYKEKGLLSIKLILGTLRRGQIQSFVAQFSRYSGLPDTTVLEIIMQPSGQGLAVACRAFNVGREDFISIYLLTNRARSRGGMADMKDITRAINYYNRITPEVARDIMGNSLDG